MSHCIAACRHLAISGAIDTTSIVSNANFVNLPAAAIGGFNAAGAALTPSVVLFN